MTHLTPTQRLMMLSLSTAAKPISIANLATAIGSTPSTVIDRAQDLCSAGLIARVKRGSRTLYTLPTPTPTPQSDSQQQQ
jgi:Mn-dependent DtxR family transcriptional regulator